MTCVFNVHDIFTLMCIGLQMECLTTWYQGNKIFLIARLLGRNTDVANCFVSILLHLPVECNHSTIVLRVLFVTIVITHDCRQRHQWRHKTTGGPWTY